MYSLQYGAPFHIAGVNLYSRNTQIFQSFLNGSLPLQRYDHVSTTLLMGVIASLHFQISLLNINLYRSSRYLLIYREQMILLLNRELHDAMYNIAFYFIRTISQELQLLACVSPYKIFESAWSAQLIEHWLSVARVRSLLLACGMVIVAKLDRVVLHGSLTHYLGFLHQYRLHISNEDRTYSAMCVYYMPVLCGCKHNTIHSGKQNF